jgi:integrase
MLRTRRRKQKEDALLSGDGWSDERWVFPAANGEMLYPTRVRDGLMRACEKAGVPYPKVHGLRHTGGSLAYARRSVTEKAIQERLGHSKLATTQDIYLHTEAAQHRELGDLMGELLHRRRTGTDPESGSM